MQAGETLSVTRVANGFIVQRQPDSFGAPIGDTHVAKTPDEVADIVRAWAATARVLRDASVGINDLMPGNIAVGAA